MAFIVLNSCNLGINFPYTEIETQKQGAVIKKKPHSISIRVAVGQQVARDWTADGRKFVTAVLWGQQI